MTQSKDDKFTTDLSGLDIEDTISIDTCTLSDRSIGDITLTIGDLYELSDINDYVDNDTIDISSIANTTIDTAYDVNLDWATNITIDRVMFEDDMPDPQEIKRMCEEYPALEKVYENFKTVYKMVEQDWKGKTDDDEELPF